MLITNNLIEVNELNLPHSMNTLNHNKIILNQWSKLYIQVATLFLLICTSELLYSQAPYYQKIGTEQGLPTSTVYDLFSAREGHLYLGVETGLARFNGTNFELFPMIGNRSRSVNAIQQAEDGVIWCMNFTNQIFFLDRDTLRAASEINKIIDNSAPLRDFVLHQRGIYFLTEKELFLQNTNGVIQKVFGLDTTLIDNNSFLEVIPAEKKSMIYLADGKYVYKIDKNHKVVDKRLLVKGQNMSIVFQNKIVTVPKSNIKKIRVGDDISNFKNGDASTTYLNHLSVIDDELWLCTNTGLFLLNNETNIFDQQFFSKTRVTDIEKDFEGGYWVSSIDRGLFYIPNKELKQIKISDYNVYRVCEGPGQSFFIGTGNGEVYHYSILGELLAQLKTDYFSEVEFLHYEEKGNRLISSHGLFLLNKNYAYKPIRIGKSISYDNKGNILFNTYNQAILMNENFESEPVLPEKLKGQVGFGKYSNYEIPFLSLFNNRSNSGFFDTLSNSFYIGAYDALRKVDYKGNGRVISYKDENIIVLDIFKDKAGSFLLSTQKHGLLEMKNDNVTSFYDLEKGLSSNTCIKAIKTNNFIFVLTDLGLNMINSETQRVTNISANLSLKNINIFDFTIIQDKLYLASDVGLLQLTIPKETPPKFPRLNGLSFFRAKETVPLSEIELSFNDNNLRFVSDAIHFQNNGQYGYSYRLVGLDETWQEQSSKNNVFSYLAIPPGSYTFELRMKMNETYSQTYSQTFFIRTPYWQSPWFYFAAFILTVFLSYLIFRKLLLQQRKKQLIKQRLLQSQMVSLRSQMNPHFLFNIVNSVQGLIYANKKNEASNLLGKMSMLMRRVLEVSDKPKISIQKELEILNAYVELEAARFDDDFSYVIKTNIPIEEQDILIPSLIIQPFIENAIKHGLMHKKGEKQLTIELNKKRSQEVEITIIDNGIGREASQKINAKRVNHQSFASDAIESRITLINKANGGGNISLKIDDLYDEINNPKGTKIIINIDMYE